MSAEAYAAGGAIFNVQGLATLRGQLGDAAGKPLAHARVFVAGARQNPGDPIISDADGRFAVPDLLKGQAVIAVEPDPAAAASPAYFDLAVNDASTEQKLVLPPRRLIRGRVIDKLGKPVAGAIVQSGTHGNHRLLNFEARTDADGVFTWPSGPAGALVVEVFREGFDVGRVMLKAGASDLTVTLSPVLRIAGSVVDARTRKPILSFVVLKGRYNGSPPRRTTLRTLVTHFTGGKYDLSFYGRDRRGDEVTPHYVRIEAEGYRPAFSRPLDLDEGSQALDFALEPAEPISGRVVDASGAPVLLAQVAIATATMPLDLYRGEVRREQPLESALFTTTDAAGNFKLPPQAEPYKLFVSHDSGWARTQGDNVSPQAVTMKLQAWGHIEGEVRKNGKPAADAQVTLTDSSDEQSAAHPDEPWVQFFSTQQTGPDGRYVFPKVFPGQYRVSGQNEVFAGGMSASGPGVPIRVEAGKTLSLSFGGSGEHAVTGRIVVDAQADAKVDFSSMVLEYAPAEKDGPGATTHPARHRLIVDADGVFTTDALTAGAWAFYAKVDLSLPDADPDRRGLSAVGEWSIEVPAGRGGPAIPLGEFTLAARRASLSKGQAAPDFNVTSVTGKPLDLRQLRGKFVLLHFWASWCGPCVAEMPNLHDAYDAYKDDPRLVMIGLNLDENIDRFRADVKAHDLAWPQAHLNGEWHSGTVEAYGVGAIPIVLLIGPDGNLIDANLRGPSIKAAVAKALSEPAGR